MAKQIIKRCRVRIILSFLSGLMLAAYFLLRSRRELMKLLSETIVRPLHRWLASQCDGLPFSVAELLIGGLGIGLLVYIIIETVLFFRKEEKGLRLASAAMTLLTCFCLVYGGFCLLWGVYYYADDFAAVSGLSEEPVSVEQLQTVTEYFARLANESGANVSRDARGVYNGNRKAILAQSPEVFAGIEAEYPFLAGPAVHAKGIHFSKIMSLTDFTGFFFPFTGEANVNIDFPPSLLASTVAHELSHQRGVAREQEANFTAVLASLRYGDPDYVYSAALLAYTHLGNALYKADREAWEPIYESLSDEVKIDFAFNRAYWQQFETPVQSVSNTVYEGFLQSYGQKLGLQSYGACVDLLVNYYYDAACTELGK